MDCDPEEEAIIKAEDNDHDNEYFHRVSSNILRSNNGSKFFKIGLILLQILIIILFIVLYSVQSEFPTKDK